MANEFGSLTLRMLVEHPLDVPVLQWVIFGLIAVLASTLLYLQMRNDHLDLRWLILDRPHRPSLTKIAQVVALLVSTWGFIVLTWSNQLTETYFIFYMGTWSGSAAIDAYISRRYGGRQSQTERASDTDPPAEQGNPYDEERK